MDRQRRREYLDRMLITGERHLRLVLSEYIDHYNTHRPHRTLQQNPPVGRARPHSLEANVRVLRRDRLGGLIREYAQVAYGDGVFGTHRSPADLTVQAELPAGTSYQERRMPSFALARDLRLAAACQVGAALVRLSATSRFHAA
jgi:hypothetical protein